MSYIIEKFGSLLYLPKYDPNHDIGTGAVSIESVDGPRGGAYDMRGRDDALRGGFRLKCKGTIIGTSGSTLDTQYNAIRAMLGKKDQLYRLRDTGAREWVWARLENVEASREARNNTWLEIDMTFYVFSPFWNGTFHGSWRFDEGYYFDEGLNFDSATAVSLTANNWTSITLANGGNAAVRDTIITITAVGTPITRINVQRSAGYSQFYWFGSVAVGTQLVIDCGAMSIRNNGEDAYSGFAFASNHKIDDWLRLDLGNNYITLYSAGGTGGSTADFVYSDGWM